MKTALTIKLPNIEGNRLLETENEYVSDNISFL